MLGLSGRTGRAPFAIVMSVCFLGGVVLLATKPLIRGLSGLDPDQAIVAGNIMAVCAVGWTVGGTLAWLVFSLRRLRDAGLHPAFAAVSVVLGVMNDPRTLVDPGGWAERPLGVGMTVLCLGWLAILTAWPSRHAKAAPYASAPVRLDPVASRTRFGLR